LETSNIRYVMPLDISLQRFGDAHFHKSVVTKLATATPQKPMDWVRKAQVDAGSVPGDPISAELCWSIREVTSYAGEREIMQGKRAFAARTPPSGKPLK
jgi:hypothetical protein